jgi:ubiquitin C-terminal hydrolase
VSCAVISHHGGESGRGHYTADVRQASGRWLCFDDAYVHVVSPDEVMRRQAYLLFYILSGSP